MDQVELRGLRVVAIDPEQTDERLAELTPDLVVLFGLHGGEALFERLQGLPGLVPLVLVVAPEEVRKARSIGGGGAVSVLTSELPSSILAERMASFIEGPEQPTLRPPFPPSSEAHGRRLVVADDDVSRADAFAAALREHGFQVQLSPADPSAIRWTALERFQPGAILIDGSDEQNLRAWLDLQNTERRLEGIAVRGISFPAAFDEANGVARADVLLSLIAGIDPGPTSSSSTEGDFDDERPTLVYEARRQGAQGSLVVTPASAPPRESSPKVRPRAGDLVPSRPAPRPPARSGIPSWAPLGFLAAGALVLGIGGWWLQRNSAPAPHVAMATTHDAGEPATLETDSASAPPAEPTEPSAPTDPWVASENSAAPSCEELVEEAEVAPGDIAQASRFWEQARAALVAGDIKKAHSLMCRAVLSHAESRAAEGLAERYLLMGAPLQAKRWIDVALAARPDHPKTLELSGDIDNQLGHIEPSRRAWARSLGIAEDDERSFSLLAKDHGRNGAAALRATDLARAEVLYRRAATFAPQSAEGVIGLARVALAAGQPERAALWAELAIQRDPASPEVAKVQRDIAEHMAAQAGRAAEPASSSTSSER